MSVQDLALVNSKRAKQTTINAFHRCQAYEGVTVGSIALSLLRDETGTVFRAKEANYLQGTRSCLLQASKKLDARQLPKAPSLNRKKLLKMAQTLERHCISRQEGGLIKKALSCSKRDLVDGSTVMLLPELLYRYPMWCAEETDPRENVETGIDAVSEKAPCGLKALLKAPAVFWYAKCSIRHKKSAYKQITNYINLFSHNGFVLDLSSASYFDQVMAANKEAGSGVYNFFCVHGIKSRNGSSVLKLLRKLHRDGKLNKLIDDYVARGNIGSVRDSASSRTKDFFRQRCR
ncbi:hypothetical protein ON010_g1063 [Phytophthora cinnamomi]|nr:hypothetical protein ON010_g1063 [Phytophthora cinnamomi]